MTTTVNQKITAGTTETKVTESRVKPTETKKTETTTTSQAVKQPKTTTGKLIGLLHLKSTHPRGRFWKSVPQEECEFLNAHTSVSFR